MFIGIKQGIVCSTEVCAYISDKIVRVVYHPLVTFGYGISQGNVFKFGIKNLVVFFFKILSSIVQPLVQIRRYENDFCIVMSLFEPFGALLGKGIEFSVAAMVKVNVPTVCNGFKQRQQSIFVLFVF